MWYLCYFVHRHLDYRIPEVESLAKLVGAVKPGNKLNWKLPQGHHPDSPFWFVELPSDEAARKIAERAILVKALIDVWGEGGTYDEVEAAVLRHPEERKQPFIGPESSFRLVVDGFGCTFDVNEALTRIERFRFIPFQGQVKLQGADHKFWVVETAGESTENNGLPPLVPKYVYFGREVGASDRSIVARYGLSNRRFLGPTSMDAEVALLMANQALARPGSIVYDPFVGTGSVLVAAAHFGAMTVGADIDIRVVRDGRGPNCNVWSNFEQYNLQAPVLLVRADNHSLPWRQSLQEVFDAIVCDPPYGVRAGGRKSGGRKLLKGCAESYSIPDDLREGHIPSTAPYSLAECLHDLLDVAARLLVIGGRLVYFLPMPVDPGEAKPEGVPTHPCLEHVATSEQILTMKWTRKLITMEKCKEYTPDVAEAARVTREEFRKNHVQVIAQSKGCDLHALMFSPNYKGSLVPQFKAPANGKARDDELVDSIRNAHLDVGSREDAKRLMGTYRAKNV